mgnify:FL=1
MLEMNLDNNGDLIIAADVEVTGSITTTNNKIIFLLSRFIDGDYFCSVSGYGEQAFDLTTPGDTEEYTQTLSMDQSWSLGDIKAVVVVQTFSGNKQILQAAESGFTGTLALFSSNVTEGPASLGVQFNDMSLPEGEIESWEWDFDGDGTIDSYEQSPYYLYQEEGEYDVSLTINDGENEDTKLIENYITVNDGSEISGELSGIWNPEHNPYVIANDVSLSVNNSLEINPGTEIIFNNDSKLTVTGHLTANAEGSEPIRFTTESSWQGLKFSYSESPNVLNNCRFYQSEGAAINILESQVEIKGSIFKDNSHANTAGGIHIQNASDVMIHGNIITNNSSSSSAAAINCVSATPTITNNLIVNNEGLVSGGISLKTNSDATIINNTIAYNISNNETGGAIFNYNSNPILMNNIIYGNNSQLSFISGNPEISYSCIEGGYDGEGCIDSDPLFANPPEYIGLEGDGLNAIWHLSEDSPCIDAGNPDEEYNDPEDTENPGNALFPAMGSLTNDIGAYGGGEITGWVTTNEEFEDDVDIHTNYQTVYPNPFILNSQSSSSANIKLHRKSFPQNSIISADIYNIKGRKIKTLINNVSLTKINELSWNGTDNNGKQLAAGIYFIRIKSQDIDSKRKILLLK